MPGVVTNSSFSMGTLTFDGANDRIGVGFQASSAMTVTGVKWLTGTVTVGSTVNVRIETSSNGRPSGTLWATNTSAAVVIANGDDTVWKTATLTASATIAAGDQVWVVFTHNTGSPNMVLLAYMSTLPPRVFPMLVQDTGTGTYAGISGTPAMILLSSGASVRVPGLMPYSSATLSAYDSADSPDEYACSFIPPMKSRCVGALLGLMNIAAGADFKVFLWDNSGATNTESNALASASFDGDIPPATTTDGLWEVYWSSPVTLDAGSTYHVGVRAQTATANGVTVLVWNMAATGIPADAIDASPAGPDCVLKTRAWSAIDPGTVGAWTTDATKQPAFRLLLDQVDDGTGTGGGGGLLMANKRANML
jgi:hypothetical protein